MPHFTAPSSLAERAERNSRLIANMDDRGFASSFEESTVCGASLPLDGGSLGGGAGGMRASSANMDAIETVGGGN